MAQWIKDLSFLLLWLWLLLWCGFNPWPGNFCMLWAQLKKKKRSRLCFLQPSSSLIHKPCWPSNLDILGALLPSAEPAGRDSELSLLREKF